MQAEHRECKSPTPLFTWLQQRAVDNPALVFSCAGLIESEAQRDRILRDAFLAALAKDPAVARQNLSAVIDRPWITDAGFFPLVSLAISIPSRELLIKAAQRYPALALRDFDSYSGLEFSREVFDEAARVAPDEAVGLASGESVAAQAVLERLRQSSASEIQALARLARDTNLPVQVRSRAAVFYRRLTMQQAVNAASGAGFFPAVAKLRIGASGLEAALYDRVLENYAEVLFRTVGLSPELKQFEARDLYLLLTYGRTEEDDKLFTTVFDRLLLPKLRAQTAAKLLDEVQNLNLRRFLANAIAHHRLEAFLTTAGNKAMQSGLLVRGVRGIEQAERPLEETIAAAELIEAVQDPSRLTQLNEVILAEYARAHITKLHYGLLAASIARKMASGTTSVASQYQGYFKQQGMLDSAALFSLDGTCIQQQFFYDDDDAAESFESFKKQYAGDGAWHWEDHGWYVKLTGTGATGRRITIFANVPHPILSNDTDDRRHAMVKMMTAQGLSPTVVIHRGHTWYVEQTLRYLTPSAGLVYLGSCRGSENTYSVIAIANRAQVIATSGIGTHLVNDPLLKALNDELLRGEAALDWDRFWRAQTIALRRDPTFRDYVPPQRNAAATLLAAYFAAGQ